MIPYEQKPTVQIFYKLFAHQKYVPHAYYCIESDFIESYVTEKKSFIDDELYIQQEKEFVLTTLKQVGAPTKNRT
jgi:hypothetical protein